MNKIKLILGVAFILLILFYLAQGVFWLFKDSPPEKASVYTPSSQDAYAMTKYFIEQKLKAPSTSTFASESESKISALENNTWEVVSYVDAQNSFGAMIRTHFTARIKYVSNKKWKLVDYKEE